MESREEEDITWLDYYQAIKRGDLPTVQRSGKNFRLPLTLNLSALQLAAAYGHLELVRHFLSQCDGKLDRTFVYHASETASYECAELLLDHVKPLTENEVSDFVHAMVQSNNLDYLRLIDLEKYASEASEVDMFFLSGAAICSGSTECIKFLYEHFKNSDGYKASSCSAVTAFVTRLSEGWELERYIRLNQEGSHSITLFNCDGYMHHSVYSEKYISAMDTAAYLGRVDMLKYLIQSAKDENGKFGTEEWDHEIEFAMRMALNNNQVNVVQYLVENELVTAKPPYEYEDFRINEAFDYLWQRTKEKVGGDGRLPEELTRAWQWCRRYEANVNFIDTDERGGFAGPYNIRKSILDSENHFNKLLEIGDGICEESYDSIFMEVLAQQNVEAVLCLKNRVGKISCQSTSNYYRCLKKALRCYTNDDMETLPSPVIVELALWVLENVEHKCSCTCSRLCPMEHFLEPPKFNRLRERDQPLSFPSQPLEFLTEGTDAILEILVKRGYRKPEFVFRVAYQFFCQGEPVQPVYAARVLTLLRSCKLRCSQIEVYGGAAWFIRRDFDEVRYMEKAFTLWNDTDYFLTEFILAISAHDHRLLDFEGLLVYFMDPPERADHYINCLNQTRLVIRDPHIADEPAQESPSFAKVVKTAHSSRLLTLQSLCRRSLHHYSLKLAIQELCSISARRIVKNLGQRLPPRLGEFLLFKDLYCEETMELIGENKESEPRLIERVMGMEGFYDAESDDDFFIF